MSDLIVSIIESLAGAAAAAAEWRRTAGTNILRAPDAPRYQAWHPREIRPPGPVVEPVSKAVTQTAPLEPVPEVAAPAAALAFEPRSLIAGPHNLLRTILSAEIIGLPIALRRHNPWDDSSV